LKKKNRTEDKPIICEYCDNYATFLYDDNGFVIYICRECNKEISKEVETMPFLRVFDGGKIKGGQNGQIWISGF
jgi:hypothetical protein